MEVREVLESPGQWPVLTARPVWASDSSGVPEVRVSRKVSSFADGYQHELEARHGRSTAVGPQERPQSSSFGVISLGGSFVLSGTDSQHINTMLGLAHSNTKACPGLGTGELPGGLPGLTSEA